MTDYNIENNTYSDNFSTTFWQDFSVADHTLQLTALKSGSLYFLPFKPESSKQEMKIKAIKDTYNRAFKSWKNDYRYLTDLVIQLNHKIWQWYETDEKIARVYNDLWEQADTYACENLKGNELKYFYHVTD